MPLPAAHNDTSFPVTGRYTVSERNDAPRPRWNGWVEATPGGGHLFQSHEWGEMKRTLGWRPVRLVMEKDGRVVGAGQFLLYDTPLVPGSLMYCPKGPWLPWDDGEAVAAFFRGVVEAAGRHGAHTVKIEPEVPEDRTRVKELLSGLGFRKFRWNINHKTTMVVDLSRSEEELLAGMKKGTRYGVRRAAREGVEVVEDNSPEALDDFWRMHGEMVERKGFWSRPRAYYSAVWRAMEGAGRAHLFFAERGGERLATALVYTFGGKCVYMLGATARDERDLYPGYLLQWEVMRRVREHGVTDYDMWGVPTPDKMNEDHPLYGVYKWKAGFGGEVRDFIGCLDLPVRGTRARMWDRVEPAYFRLHQRLKGDVYY